MDLEWKFACRKQKSSLMNGFTEATSIVINDQTYPVGDNVAGDTSLNAFIRGQAGLKGTKWMCLEGGCGACIVHVERKHPLTGAPLHAAVNSCLVPVVGCAAAGWRVTTVEGLGGGRRGGGYHPVQARLAKGNGSQCGYCSTGFVMNMYSLLKSKPELTMAEIENSFGGNICRCTGYRPILDSFKSFAKDAPKDLVKKCADIEDLPNICPVKKKPCAMNGSCSDRRNSCAEGDVEVVELGDDAPTTIRLQDGTAWYHVTDKRQIFEILEMCNDNDYMIVGGNTAHGVYRRPSGIRHLIFSEGVAQLYSEVEAGGTLVLGANTTLTSTIDIFLSKSATKPRQFGYLRQLADHIDLIANVPVRNTGTLAGNLSIKNQHREFPSDIFLLLETVGATIVVEDAMEMETTMSAEEFSEFDMTKKLITKIIMPSIDSDYFVCRTFKITPRAQNAHAYVNAGFLFKVDKKDKFKVLEKPNIVFGGITPGFVHASATEQEVVGKQLLNAETLKSALARLEAEVRADHVLPDAGPDFRQGLAASLFYKFVLGLGPELVGVDVRSGGPSLVRPLSSGHQQIATDPAMWPVSQPVPKIEALAQCAGEAEYVNDIPSMPNEVFGAFVLSTVGPADSFKLDASKALELPGVVGIHVAKDIPGKNTILYPVGFGGVTNEPIFAEKEVPCAGTPLATIYADTHALALKAAKLVKVKYEGVKTPELDVKKIVESGDKSRLWLAGEQKAKTKKTNVKHTVKGSFWFPTQYHFTMETQTCVCVPSEDGLDVYPSSQCPTQIQDGISEALNIPRNSVNISVRRCGGGYGSKLGKSGVTAASCALGAYLLKRPVRFVLNLETNMEAIGKRSGCLFQYEVAVDENGLIQYLNVDYYQDDGVNRNDSIAPFTIHHMRGLYDLSTWTIRAYGVKTDLPSQTWCRAPGSTEAIGVLEDIMEHIAKIVKKGPIEVKMLNKRSGDLPFPTLVNDIKQSSNFNERLSDIELFNKTNRWKKRGISLVPMDYPFGYFGSYHSMVSVFGADGSVAITHGCVEMGQGLNTKVAQVCAYVLGVPVENISVKATLTLTSPNNSPTGGSGGSESVAYATKKACEELLKRLEPVKKAYPSSTWKELVAQAIEMNINLNSTYMFTPLDDVKSYSIYGVAVIEVELDILTGQHLILRADVLEDAGISLSPEVDIGQIEGAYIMGLGLYTSEQLVYSPQTGQLLTNRTWNYKVPGAKDIPIDFRVEMRKDAPNPVGVLKSKATGEPPLCMSVGVVFAMRRALESARADAGLPDEYFDIDLPLTTEKIWLYGKANPGQFHL